MTEQTNRSAPARFPPQPAHHAAIPPSVIVGVGLALALSFLGWGVSVGWGTQVLVPVALIVGVLGVVFWREALFLVFACLLVEGFISNVFYLSKWPLLLKDGLLAMVYLGFLVEEVVVKRRNVVFPSLFNLPLVLLFLFALAQVFNPESTGVLAGLVGLKTGFFYMPLCFVAYHLFESKKQVFTFCLRFLLMALLVVGYGIVQFFQGTEAYTALGPGFKRATFAAFMELSAGQSIFRPNSTFAWSAHFAFYVAFCICLTLGLTQWRTPRWFHYFCQGLLLLLSVGLFLSGQRSLMVLFPLLLVPLFLILSRERASISQIQTLLLLLGGLAIALFTTRLSVLDRVGSVLLVAEGKQQPGLLRYATLNVPVYLSIGLRGGFTGRGTGSATISARYVSSNITMVENYYGKILFELGIVGLFLFVWLYLAIMRQTWLAVRRSRDPALRSLALGIFLYQVAIAICQFGGTILDLSVTNLCFWFFTGMAIRDAELAEGSK